MRALSGCGQAFVMDWSTRRGSGWEAKILLDRTGLQVLRDAPDHPEPQAAACPV
jgi:hypothetical protein